MTAVNASTIVAPLHVRLYNCAVWHDEQARKTKGEHAKERHECLSSQLFRLEKLAYDQRIQKAIDRCTKIETGARCRTLNAQRAAIVSGALPDMFAARVRVPGMRSGIRLHCVGTA